MQRSLISGISLLALLVGCATPKAYTPPPKAALQDPLPGKALVYLLRAPYDEEDLSLDLSNQSKSISLQRYRYTAVSVDAGAYTLKTTIKGADSKDLNHVVPPLTFTIDVNQRLCFFLPAPERRNVQSFGLGTLPIVTRRMEETGAPRAWTPATPDDVNWFIHYTKPSVE